MSRRCQRPGCTAVLEPGCVWMSCDPCLSEARARGVPNTLRLEPRLHTPERRLLGRVFLTGKAWQHVDAGVRESLRKRGATVAVDQRGGVKLTATADVLEELGGLFHKLAHAVAGGGAKGACRAAAGVVGNVARSVRDGERR